jgi:acyl-CoA synthetase (AMP-forming)/AMP-acid ligase II
MLQCLKKGAKLVTLPKFDPEEFLKILSTHKNIVMHAVPPMILFLGAHPAVKLQHLNPINAILVGGAPCSPGDIQRVQEKRFIPILQGIINDLSNKTYSLSELVEIQ